VYFFSRKILCLPSFFKNTLQELPKDWGEKKRKKKAGKRFSCKDGVAMKLSWASTNFNNNNKKAIVRMNTFLALMMR